MVRVAHQKTAKQANATNGVRGSKIAKQRKNHKVVIESESQDKEKSRAVLSFRADPPPGYTFIPAGNPQLTAALKEFAKKGNHQILAVTTTPHATRHELSREVHRIGFHFPTEVVAQVCNHYGIRLTSGGKLVEEKDDDKLFMRLYQKGQLVLDEKVRDQVTINTEAKQIIKDLFPNIPDNDLFQIIKTAFQLGDGKVGTADEIPLVRRAQLSVVAHIRHCYTNYDKLLRSVPYSEARHKVENITLQKLIDWRGDGQDDNRAMDDTLREVVVISDEGESDDEIEDGQVLENEHVHVQPVNGVVPSKHIVDGRPRSPIDIISDDEAPKGYRYLPQVVRKYPIQDPQAVSATRQQSRYAVWDRVRQEYRAGVVPEPPRVVERILIEEPPVIPLQVSYVNREPIYIPENIPRRVVEPAVSRAVSADTLQNKIRVPYAVVRSLTPSYQTRIVAQPSPPTYVRGADGKLYERISTYPEQTASSIPVRRIFTPPPTTEYNRQYVDSRQASPRPIPPRLHRRTESYENSDGTVLPSIEGPNGVFSSPMMKRNPFEETRPTIDKRNSGAFDLNQRQAPLIDLTNSAEQASKRRKMEELPPSPYLSRHPEYNQHDVDRKRAIASHQSGNSFQLPQPTQLIPLETPAMNYASQGHYEKVESRQPAVVYREEIQDVPSPRPMGTRYYPTGVREPHQIHSPRRLEYVDENDRHMARSYGESPRQLLPIQSREAGDRNDRVVLQQLPLQAQVPNYYTEPSNRYIQSEAHNAFDQPMQSQYYASEQPLERTQREYISSMPSQYAPVIRDIPAMQPQHHEATYQNSRMPPPPIVYRDGQNVRTTYVQN